MNSVKYESAILDGWDLPLFPDSLDQLAAAQDENRISTFYLLEKAALLVDSFIKSGRSLTLDGYFWFCSLYFAAKNGQVVILFPWKMKSSPNMESERDRSIAVYTKGDVSVDVVERIILKLIEAMKKMAMKSKAEEIIAYHKVSMQRHHDFFVFLHRELEGEISDLERKNYELAMSREAAGDVTPLPENAINYFKVEIEKEKLKEPKG